MPNLYATKPEVEQPVLSPVWTCPVTGLRVPMEPSANLNYRKNLMQKSAGNKAIQVALYTACSQSLEFWINSFVFTLRVFESGKDGKQQQASSTHVPFCLWPVQQELVQELQLCIGTGKELLVDKSRDMGATWCHVATLLWFFLFRPDQSFLMISRKEDAVDQLDGMARNYPNGSVADPGTLFGKLDYILSRLPEWMLPPLTRKKMHLVNGANKSRIDGESANATAGSSDRRTAIFLDEFAKMDEAESIKRSTKDVTACRLVCSTPNGAGTTFSKWRMSGQIKVFPLMWWTHPEKAMGVEARQDALSRWRIHSPWYDAECAVRSPKEVAVEIDADHVGSGDTFFDASMIEQQKRMYARPPKTRCSIAWRGKFSDEKIVEFVRKAEYQKTIRGFDRGPWKIWCELNEQGRPDQARTYTMGVDISKGQGASNSVMVIVCNETKEKIAEYADANTPPYELARLACAAAIWCGGRNKRPCIIFENNGDCGFDFGRQLLQVYHYPNIYYDKQVGTVRERTGKRYGFRSNTEKKATALGLLRRAYAHGKYINRSAEALAECLSYVHYEGGGIGPAELVTESESTRKAHGDRVIADMLCTWQLQFEGRLGVTQSVSAPHRSIGHRLEEYKRRRKLSSDLPRIGQKIVFGQEEAA